MSRFLRIVEWFSLGTPVSSTNKTNSHDITEIVFKVALSNINHQTRWNYTSDPFLVHVALNFIYPG